MSAIVGDRIFKPGFGSKIAGRKPRGLGLGFERTRHGPEPFLSADRSTDDDPHLPCRNKPNDRIAIFREPAFDAGIYDLKRCRIPTVRENQLPCAFKI